MRLQSALMMVLKDHISHKKLSQSQAAKLIVRDSAARVRSHAREDRVVWPRQLGEHGVRCGSTRRNANRPCRLTT